ncbi:hypothetical protein BDI4_90022 [Burkholderia diffusa]|nr:hypothetical protein BDI4_90022 [Burkholderia diffusa]
MKKMLDCASGLGRGRLQKGAARLAQPVGETIAAAENLPTRFAKIPAEGRYSQTNRRTCREF